MIVAMYPFDAVRVHQALSNNMAGSFDAICDIYAKFGVHGFFRGWIPSFISVGSFIACNFATFDYLKTSYIHKNVDEKTVNSFVVFRLGVMAGLVAHIICHPLDNIRLLMLRSSYVSGNNYSYHSIFDCPKLLQMDAQKAGIKSILYLYRGIFSKGIQMIMIPQNGVRFLAYVKLTQYFGISTTATKKIQRKD